jgi:hypothetical protein
VSKRNGFLAALVFCIFMTACGPQGPLRSFTKGEELIFYDFNTASQFEQGVYETASLLVRDGVYRVDVRTGNNELWWGQWGEQYDNVVIDVDADQQSEPNENAFGIMCRARGRVGMRPDGTGLLTSTDESVAQMMATMAATISPTETAAATAAAEVTIEATETAELAVTDQATDAAPESTDVTNLTAATDQTTEAADVTEAADSEAEETADAVDEPTEESTRLAADETEPATESATAELEIPPVDAQPTATSDEASDDPEATLERAAESEQTADANLRATQTVASSSNGDSYLFLIQGTGSAGIFRARGRDLQPLADWRTSDAIRVGPAQNHLRAVCVGDYLAFYVNDVLVADATDDAYTGGQVGLAASAANRLGATIEFDNLSVSQATTGG